MGLVVRNALNWMFIEESSKLAKQDKLKMLDYRNHHACEGFSCYLPNTLKQKILFSLCHE